MDYNNNSKKKYLYFFIWALILLSFCLIRSAYGITAQHGDTVAINKKKSTHKQNQHQLRNKVTDTKQGYPDGAAKAVQPGKAEPATSITSVETTINGKVYLTALTRDGRVSYFEKFGKDTTRRTLNNRKQKPKKKSRFIESGSITVNSMVYFYTKSAKGRLTYYDPSGTKVNDKEMELILKQ